jgi:hypothetical protein
MIHIFFERIKWQEYLCAELPNTTSWWTAVIVDHYTIIQPRKASKVFSENWEWIILKYITSVYEQDTKKHAENGWNGMGEKGKEE